MLCDLGSSGSGRWNTQIAVRAPRVCRLHTHPKADKDRNIPIVQTHRHQSPGWTIRAVRCEMRAESTQYICMAASVRMEL